jgi:imidazolonepropionase-like amidohydrolase
MRDDAIYAVQLGLDRAAALKALTLNAAKILGVEDRVGTIQTGKDADLLVFSGDPFDPGSRLETVIINGHVLDPEN